MRRRQANAQRARDYDRRSNVDTRRKQLRVTARVGALLAGVGILAWAVLARRGSPTKAGDEVELLTSTAEVVKLLDGVRQTQSPPDPRPGAHDFPPPWPRVQFDRDAVEVLLPQVARPRYEYDPELLYRARPGEVFQRQMREHPRGSWSYRTNSLGFHESEEPLARRPDLRVLFTGASNVQGVCGVDESLPNVLEAELRRRRAGQLVEVLNAGQHSYNFFNYVAVLERFAELQPDAFVLAAYGGNDFFSCVKAWRYVHGRGAPKYEPHRIGTVHPPESAFVRGLLATEIAQAVYLLNNPGDVDTVIAIACSATAQMHSLCAARGIALVLAYIPPPLRGQPELPAAEREESLRSFGVPAESFDVSDRIADAWLDFARSRDIATLDLRPLLRAETRRMYWKTDSHLNLEGYALAAHALLPVLESALNKCRMRTRIVFPVRFEKWRRREFAGSSTLERALRRTRRACRRRRAARVRA